jgi:hypothetical protein
MNHGGVTGGVRKIFEHIHQKAQVDNSEIHAAVLDCISSACSRKMSQSPSKDANLNTSANREPNQSYDLDELSQQFEQRLRENDLENAKQILSDANERAPQHFTVQASFEYYYYYIDDNNANRSINYCYFPVRCLIFSIVAVGTQACTL